LPVSPNFRFAAGIGLSLADRALGGLEPVEGSEINDAQAFGGSDRGRSDPELDERWSSGLSTDLASDSSTSGMPFP
jgi:hypothetical protein